jgi:hypothetical protein
MPTRSGSLSTPAPGSGPRPGSVKTPVPQPSGGP